MEIETPPALNKKSDQWVQRARDKANSSQTLALKIDGARTATVQMPLARGTYEFLDPTLQFEIATFVALKASPETRRKYTPQLEKFFIWMQYAGHEDIRHCTEWWLMEYQQILLDPPVSLKDHPTACFTPTREETVDAYLKVIKGFLTYLFDKGHLSYNPGKHLPNLAVQDLEDDILRMPDDKQWQTINDTLLTMPQNTPGQRNRAARIRFAYALGLRITEHATHSHAHIAYRKGLWAIGVVGKGRKRRWLSLEGNGLDDLALQELTIYRTYLGLHPTPQGEALPLLPAKVPVTIKHRGKNKGITINTTPIKPHAWREQFRLFIYEDVMNQLHPDDVILREQDYTQNWKHLTPHSLRHRRITDLVEKFGKSLPWVQQFAGHSDPKTTMRYFHGDL